VVLLNDWVKDRSEIFVRVPVTSIDTTVLVVEGNSTSNSLSEGKSRCLSFDILEFVPFLLVDMLRNKRMLGGNEREISEVLLLVFLVFLP